MGEAAKPLVVVRETLDLAMGLGAGEVNCSTAPFVSPITTEPNSVELNSSAIAPTGASSDSDGNLASSSETRPNVGCGPVSSTSGIISGEAVGSLTEIGAGTLRIRGVVNTTPTPTITSDEVASIIGFKFGFINICGRFPA